MEDRPAASDNQVAAASIIICTCNRADSLALTLQAIEACNLPESGLVELIVVDNASKDNTREITEAFTSNKFAVRYVYEGKRGKGNAYNAGIAAAAGEILLFTDDDVRPAPGWLTEHIRQYDNPEISGVQGRIELEFDAEPPAWMTTIHRSFLAETCPSDQPIYPYDKHLVGANMSFRKSDALRAGPFNPLLGPGRSGFWDESEFTMRLMKLGCKLKYCPAASVRHIIGVGRLTRDYFKDAAFRQGVSSFIVEGIGTLPMRTVKPGEMRKAKLRQLKLRVRARIKGENYEACQDHLFFLMYSGACWAYHEGMERLTQKYSS